MLLLVPLTLGYWTLSTSSRTRAYRSPAGADGERPGVSASEKTVSSATQRLSDLACPYKAPESIPAPCFMASSPVCANFNGVLHRLRRSGLKPGASVQPCKAFSGHRGLFTKSRLSVTLQSGSSRRLFYVGQFVPFLPVTHEARNHSAGCNRVYSRFAHPERLVTALLSTHSTRRNKLWRNSCQTDPIIRLL